MTVRGSFYKWPSCQEWIFNPYPTLWAWCSSQLSYKIQKKGDLGRSRTCASICCSNLTELSRSTSGVGVEPTTYRAGGCFLDKLPKPSSQVAHENLMPFGKVSYNSAIRRHPTRPAWYFNFHICENCFNELSTPCQIRTGTFVETNRLALNALPYFESCSFRCFCKFYLLTGTPSTTSSNHSVVTIKGLLPQLFPLS